MKLKRKVAIFKLYIGITPTKTQKTFPGLLWLGRVVHSPTLMGWDMHSILDSKLVIRLCYMVPRQLIAWNLSVSDTINEQE